MKFAVENTKTPEQILLEKQINNQVVYIHTRKDKPGHVFYVGEGNTKRPYNKNSRNQYWKDIVKKHGYNVHIIKTNLTVEESVDLEIKLTRAYKSIGMAEACLIIGGYGKKIYSDETRLKMSISAKGKIFSDETRKKLSIAKKNISDKTRLKMSISHKNISDKTRLKMSISHKNISDKTRLKMSISHKNISDKTRLKMSISHKNISDKTRLKMSISHKNISDETRLKMSISAKCKIVSNGTKLKMSIAHKNISDETRLKISIASKNISDETRLKMSVASKGRGSKPVQAYIGEQIISNFNSATEAEFVIGIFSRGRISTVCNGREKTYGIYDLENQKFVSLTPAQLKESPNCKRVSWRFI